MRPTPDARATYAPGRPVPVGAILRPLRRGAGDPTYAHRGSVHVLARLTPHGPATLSVRSRTVDVVEFEAWGAGAEWAVQQAPALLGDRDDPSGFEPQHAVVCRLHHQHPHDRVPRSGLVLSELIPTIIEQRVTGK